MHITDHPSPNFDSRDGQAVDMLVLHYTGMPSAQAALQRMCDPQAKVSAHYMVDEDGSVLRLVAEDRRAWHAGASSWRGQTNINQRSIGIEIVNPGHEFGYRPFPKIQMQAVAALCRDILSRHAIPRRNVVAHSDIAPSRKEDPGELFDWEWMAKQGVGLWPPETPRHQLSPLRLWGSMLQLLLLVMGNWPQNFFFPRRMRKSLPKDHLAVRPLDACDRIQAQLAEYGYDCPQTGQLDDKTQKVIIAFQRHFHPRRLTGKWDRECALRLASLLAMR